MDASNTFIIAVTIFFLSMIGVMMHSDYLAAQIEIAKLECRK